LSPDEIDDAPLPLVETLQADAVGAWLPHALADLLAAIYGAAGAKPPTRSETLRAWGLGRQAAMAEREESRMRDETTWSTIQTLKSIQSLQTRIN